MMMIDRLLLSKWTPRTLLITAAIILAVYNLPLTPAIIVGSLCGAAAGLVGGQAEHRTRVEILQRLAGGKGGGE